MLHVQDLNKTYGVATVLADVTFVLNDVGLIGPNGIGKSTLLRCLAGTERPDRGTVVLTPPGARIGYLPQAFAESDTRTVGQLMADVDAEFGSAEMALAAAGSLAHAADVAQALTAYDAALARFEALGGYTRQARTQSVLEGLGLGESTPRHWSASSAEGRKRAWGWRCCCCRSRTCCCSTSRPTISTSNLANTSKPRWTLSRAA